VIPPLRFAHSVEKIIFDFNMVHEHPSFIEEVKTNCSPGSEVNNYNNNTEQ